MTSLRRDQIIFLKRHRAAALVWLVAAVTLLGLVTWSCQTPGGRSDDLAHLRAEPEIRVRIRKEVLSARFDGPAAFQVRLDGGPSETILGPLIVSAATPGSLRLTGPDGTIRTLPQGVGVEIEPAGLEPDAAAPSPLPSRMVRIDGGGYAGRFRVHSDPLQRADPSADDGGAGGKLDIVNTVPIETYLAGVVAKELYATWPQTAFMVQAVCARSYALHERQRSLARGDAHDVESTTGDQAYIGFSELPVALRAVRATRGVVLTHQGRLLRAYYSSTCGGRASGAAEVWPTARGFDFNRAGPIQAHRRECPCDGSPVYRWEVKRNAVELGARWRSWGKASAHPIAGIGRPKSVEMEEENRTARPVRYRIIDAQGRTFSLRADEFRVASNTSAPGLPLAAREALVKSGDVEVQIRGSEAIIRGRGFGHGVGMCQFGVKALADRGETWREIAGHYYPGSELERAY